MENEKNYVIVFTNGSALFQIIELPAVRRTQPSTKRLKFLQQPMSNCYNGYMVNNNNT